MSTLGVIPNPQFVPVAFTVLDSPVFDEMPPRALKLYLKLRRYVWRSTRGPLGEYFDLGYLAVDGNYAQWAEWLGVSKPTIGRDMAALIEAGWIKPLAISQASGERSVYALGRWINIEGARVETFFLDSLAITVSQVKQSEPEEATTVTPVKQSDEPFHPRNGQGDTRVTGETVEGVTVSPVKCTNREHDTNRESWTNREQKEEDDEGQQLKLSPSHPLGYDPHQPPPLALSIARIYEHEIGGRITPLLEAQIDELVKLCDDLETWRGFFLRSLGANDRWAYITACVRNYIDPKEQAALDEQAAAHAVQRMQPKSAALVLPAGVTPDSMLTQRWQKILDALRLSIAPATFDAHLRDSRCIGHNGDADTWVVVVKSSYTVDWIEGRLAPVIRRVLAREGLDQVRIQFMPQEVDR